MQQPEATECEEGLGLGFLERRPLSRGPAEIAGRDCVSIEDDCCMEHIFNIVFIDYNTFLTFVTVFLTFCLTK